jgi:hypothetical protein
MEAGGGDSMWTLGGMGERSVKSRELRNKELASPSCGLYWRKCRHSAGEGSRWGCPNIAHAEEQGSYLCDYC